MSYLEQILVNIIGGVLASLVFFAILELIRWLRKLLSKRGFKQIFGNDVINEYCVVYGKMVLIQGFDDKGQPIEWPYRKIGTTHAFRISSPVSFTETKSAKYISESFEKNVNRAPKLVSDEEIQDKLDISYCSLGGFNNLKSIDVLENDENTFFKIENGSIIDKESDNTCYQVDGVHDFAIIIKIIPKNFPNRVWLAVIGLGEWGTSGASWYLSKNWGKIRKIAKNNSFGIILKVKGGQDESAEIVYTRVKK